MKIGMIVLSALMLITAICPWVSVDAMGTSKSALGVEAWQGVLCLVLSAGAIALACIDVARKFSIIPTVLSIIFIITYYIKVGDASSMAGIAAAFGTKMSVTPGWGLILFTIFAIGHLVLSILELVKALKK
tara:strand:+ start:114 stop:506 length:393 start_codon:yes stop_codon:yes gene_type:complete